MTKEETITILKDLWRYEHVEYTDKEVRWWKMPELTYKNACIMYLEQNMECVNYRDYIIEQLNKLEQIENIVDAYVTDNPREPMYDTEDYMESIKGVLEE